MLRLSLCEIFAFFAPLRQLLKSLTHAHLLFVFVLILVIVIHIILQFVAFADTKYAFLVMESDADSTFGIGQNINTAAKRSNGTGDQVAIYTTVFVVSIKGAGVEFSQFRRSRAFNFFLTSRSPVIIFFIFGRVLGAKEVGTIPLVFHVILKVNGHGTKLFAFF